VIRQPFKARTSEELIALLSAVATAILAFIIITTLYFGREIFVPIALAILLSFVLAPLVGVLQRIRMPRGLAVVSVVILAFVLIFAMGSLLATQLTQLAGDLPRYQSTISDKIQSFRETTASRGTLERGAKADLAAASLGEALKMCIMATGSESQVQIIKSPMDSAIAAASFAS
jgi:predicted PurR-regulated permease PerM